MNTFGRKFRVSIFGESHGELIGAVMDGVPAGLELSEQDFEQDILRRKSGAKGTTPRIEDDKPMIVSGIYEGHTTGAPLTIVFRNSNTRSQDYSLFEAMPRPGHADLTAALKWDDCQDPRGGGHFSGRITAALVAAGAICHSALKAKGILIGTHICRCAGVPDGEYELGGQPIEMKNGRATLLNSDTLAGSASNLLEELQNVVSFGIPLEDAITAVTITPARAVRLDDQIGSLSVGKCADLILLNSDLTLDSVYIDGNKI